jgi:hypothetical protein
MTNHRISFALLAIVFLYSVPCIAIETSLSKIPKKVAREVQSRPSVKKVCPTDPKWADVCTHFNKYQGKKKCEALIKASVEQPIGGVCPIDKGGECGSPDISLNGLYQLGMNKDDYMLNQLIREDRTLFVSLVDIDNDGAKELRLHRTVGSAGCMHSYFWKKDSTGRYGFIEAREYDRLAEEGSGCGSHYEFIPYSGVTYTLCINYNPPEHIPRIDTVWRGSPAELMEICTYRDCN